MDYPQEIDTVLVVKCLLQGLSKIISRRNKLSKSKEQQNWQTLRQPKKEKM
jgi:hypothetical protein